MKLIFFSLTGWISTNLWQKKKNNILHRKIIESNKKKIFIPELRGRWFADVNSAIARGPGALAPRWRYCDWYLVVDVAATESSPPCRCYSLPPRSCGHRWDLRDPGRFSLASCDECCWPDRRTFLRHWSRLDPILWKIGLFWVFNHFWRNIHCND